MLRKILMTNFCFSLTVENDVLQILPILKRIRYKNVTEIETQWLGYLWDHNIWTARSSAHNNHKECALPDNLTSWKGHIQKKMGPIRSSMIIYSTDTCAACNWRLKCSVEWSSNAYRTFSSQVSIFKYIFLEQVM